MRTDIPLSLIPAGACDCHVHVFMPEEFPYDAGRRYTPPAATVEDMLTMRRRLGFTRTVLVQPSCYGYDNRALCAALRTIDSDSARGIAVVDIRTVRDAELERLHETGIRGLRMNFHVSGTADISILARECREAEARIREYGWHLQVHVGAEVLAALAPALRTLRIPIVLDHFGGGAGAADTLAELLGEHEHIWLKLSAPYRVSAHAAYADLREPVQRYLAIAPNRLLWASDWPHTGGDGRRGEGSVNTIEPFRQEDPAALLNSLIRWVGNDTLLESILAVNPAALYGFGPITSPSAIGIA